MWGALSVPGVCAGLGIPCGLQPFWGARHGAGQDLVLRDLGDGWKCPQELEEVSSQTWCFGMRAPSGEETIPSWLIPTSAFSPHLGGSQWVLTTPKYAPLLSGEPHQAIPSSSPVVPSPTPAVEHKPAPVPPCKSQHPNGGSLWIHSTSKPPAWRRHPIISHLAPEQQLGLVGWGLAAAAAPCSR